MSPHDCKKEDELMAIETDQATLKGKMAVILLILGLLVVAGFTTVRGISERTYENEMKIEVLTEMLNGQEERTEDYRNEMRDSIRRVLTLAEKNDTRVREIEIKQAEGQGSM